MADNRFWKNGPKFGLKASELTIGQPRAYIPVLTFGRPETMPVGGVMSPPTDQIGDRVVSFIVRGKKTGATK